MIQHGGISESLGREGTNLDLPLQRAWALYPVSLPPLATRPSASPTSAPAHAGRRLGLRGGAAPMPVASLKAESPTLLWPCPALDMGDRGSSRLAPNGSRKWSSSCPGGFLLAFVSAPSPPLCPCVLSEM
jgi:hypothetical protein